MNTLHTFKWLSTLTLFLLLAVGCSSPEPTPIAMPIPTTPADLPTAATDTPAVTELPDLPTSATDTPAPTAATIDRTTEQYAIYAALLASGAPNYDLGRQLIILNETNVYDLDQFPADLSAVPPTIIEDYQAANTTPQPLEANFDLTLPYAFISEPERQQYINDWPAFFAAHPDAEGFLTFSAAGFNAEGNQALVYLSYLCGPLCGAGDLYLLVKENGTWQVQQVIGLWMS
jgi:hypothetical protein